MVANMVKRVIMNAFIDLLSKSPMEKITVNDIVAKSGVSRQTFYNYFPINTIYCSAFTKKIWIRASRKAGKPA